MDILKGLDEVSIWSTSWIREGYFEGAMT